MSSKLSQEAIGDIKARLMASDWSGSAHLCKGLLLDFPENPFLLVSVHKASVQLAAWEDARFYIASALTVAPHVAAYHLLSGRLHQCQGELDAALLAYKKVAELAPDVAAHRASIAAVNYAQENYLDATTTYQAALSIDPTQVSWWNRLARSATLTGNLALAVEAYAKSLALKEDFAILAASLEVQRQLASGSVNTGEASSRYYDAIYKGSAKYAQHGDASEYVVVWHQILDLLTVGQASTVLDLGCGPGQFAEYLSGRDKDITYTGIDFSEVAVQQAKVRCPQFRFEVLSLPNTMVVQRFAFEAVICTEVLEHIEQDLSVLESIPSGVFIYATVPNFDSFGHVRYFRNADEVVQRYGYLFNSLIVTPVALAGSSIIWLFHGYRAAVGRAVDNDNEQLQKVIVEP